MVLFKDPRRQLVTGRPVIYIRQKTVCFLYAEVIIFQFRQDKGVELVLVKISMGQIFQELVCLPGFYKRFGIFS